MGVLEEGVRSWVLAVLLGCVMLLTLAPAALAAEDTGKISGTVTEFTHSEDIIPLKNIEVTVYEANGKEVKFAITEAKGEYTVEGLPAGEYKVEFSAGFDSNQNFVTQFYEKQPSFAKATPVKVVIAEPAKSEKINAAMEVGGEIEGTVTNASTHKALPNVEVVALGAGEVEVGFAVTEADGHYTIMGLATGSYKVEFAGSAYVVQYYNGQPSFASANPVEVVQEMTVSGINAALMPKAPINTAAPVASGTPAVGHALSCTSGSWTGTPAPTFAYSWLRDGVAIPGANGSIYGVQLADQGNGLTCKVTATNKSGSVSAVSNTLIVPVPPPPPPPRPVVTLLSSKIVVSGNAALVPITCVNATCAGTIELTERVVVRRRHDRHMTSGRRTLVLGTVSYALAAGHSATIVVSLTRPGKNALVRARGHRLSAKVSASVIGGTTVSRPIVLNEVQPKHKRKRR